AMGDSPESVQMEEVRQTAQSLLASSGSAQDVKAQVLTLASIALPVSEKYRHLTAEEMLKENTAGRLVKALSILEKYGCNLTSPSRPRYWRSVKHNNPVFRTTVDAIKGGRRVLFLYGYTNQQIDGLSFPDEVSEPDCDGVAAVTLEVMTLRTEVDMLLKVSSKQTLDLGIEMKFIQLSQQTKLKCVSLVSSAPPAVSECNLCGGASSLVCPSCSDKPFCDACDDLYHRHPSRADHKRDKILKTQQGASEPSRTEASWASLRAPPDANLSPRPLSPSLSTWECAHCTTLNETRAVLCTTCDRPRLRKSAFRTEAVVDLTVLSCPSPSEWKCKSCTVVNQGSSILCSVCERPRLADRPCSLLPVSLLAFNPLYSSCSDSPRLSVWVSFQWTCQFCTFVNSKPSAACEMCSLPSKDSAGLSVPLPLQQPPPPAFAKEPESGGKPQPLPRPNLDQKRQKTMREDGLALIHRIKEAEKRGVSPEEVYAALSMCGGSSVSPCDWLTSELPHLAGGGGTQPVLSRAEAKLAWLAAGGDKEKAVRQLLRDRQVKVGGSVTDRVKKEKFQKSFYVTRMCRRLLALYDLPSWGRCELALSLLQEPDVNYSLEDVVQAVKESQDREFIRRLLNTECPVCLSIFPRSKMQSLTSCQCSVCHECFRQHFTIAVRDKHIRDMVCPACSEPDINDPEQLDSYFSTLDIQVRAQNITEKTLRLSCANAPHKKLTADLSSQPKSRSLLFSSPVQCTSGFINDGNQLKVTCPSCRKSFCAQCKKPWEPQHQDVSCEQFQLWKRENDPEYQRQGLAGYLRDNGITCPECKFQYALTKGGCMHFTCSQCRHQFCSGCNNPYYKTECKVPRCKFSGLHAHHPRDCLFYLRDWDADQLQALLQVSPPCFLLPASCFLLPSPAAPVWKERRWKSPHSPVQKHYKEYLVSLINDNCLDPAVLYKTQELVTACERHQLDATRTDGEDDNVYNARLLKKLMEVPLGEKVPRNK
uniref:Ring finger protein 31 n=1 Tax=Fundulus heteroclitus TaxID=8078 RepID=A0A3Q2U137_FUNHE